MTCGEVEQPDEHGDEHTALVVVAGEGIVHLGGNLCRSDTLGGEGAEQTGGLCHEQGGRHALTRNVTEGEVEFVTDKHITIEVAADFLSGGHRGIEVEVGTIRKEAGYHRHLDVAGDTEIALDTLLGDGGLLQLVVGGE